MTFITNSLIRYKPRKQFNFFMSNNKNYNPFIGANLGIPLNILQFVFTTEYFNKNIINPELIALQFAIGICTYGTDRLNDALDYKNNSNIVLLDEKKDYYEYLLQNYNFNLFIIFSSFIYILYISYDNIYSYPFIALLLNTLDYRNFKKKYGYLKPFYVGIFWTFGSVFLPIILQENNYNIINQPTIYLPCFLSMFASSNLLDIKDLQEDKSEKIYTLPVLFGENPSISISHISLFLAMIIFLNNPNYYDNIWISSVFQFQTFGLYFLNYNNTLTYNVSK